jgi:hypothetical protein
VRAQHGTAADAEPLLTASAVARLKNCDPHTPSDARRRGELQAVFAGRRWLYRVEDVEAWTPRPRGGQRQRAERTCRLGGCEERFFPVDEDHWWCSESHAALDREASKRAELLTEALPRDAVPLQAFVAKSLGIGRKGALNLVARGYVAAFPSSEGYNAPLLVSKADLGGLDRRRKVNRANQIRGLIGQHWRPERRRHWGRWIGAVTKGGRPPGTLSFWNADAGQKIKAARRDFVAAHGREPSLRELPVITAIPKSTIARLSQKPS